MTEYEEKLANMTDKQIRAEWDRVCFNIRQQMKKKKKGRKFIRIKFR